MDPVINVESLGRRFEIRKKKGWFGKAEISTLEAVHDLSFSIESGAKVAFIGPNGAGKSTTLKMLSGLLRPSYGAAHVCGLVPWDETRALAMKIGLVFGQRSHLWSLLPVEDSFDLLAKIYRLEPSAYLKQREKLVSVFGLEKLLPQTAQTLSLGQRMRCDLAAALLHQPSVLFLDEPTLGLDVTAKALLRDHLNALAHEFETTILLTSHDTDDIERICERVILIDHGKKLLDTTLLEMRRDYTRIKTLSLVTEEEAPLFEQEGVEVAEASAHKVSFRIDTARTSVEKVVSACLERFKIQDMTIETLPLEEVIKTLYAEQTRAA